MTGHAIYMGIQENFLEERRLEVPVITPLIFTIHPLQTMRFCLQSNLVSGFLILACTVSLKDGLGFVPSLLYQQDI